MAKIEKTVFISYRRTNIYHARAIFQDLRANGYDVFLDGESIDAGAFDQIIVNQIRARAHFVVILTPSALERCDDPNDWLRREIETAIENKRNIIPLMIYGFDWNDIHHDLMNNLKSLDVLELPARYFNEAMLRLRSQFLNMPIEVVLYPPPSFDVPEVNRKIEEQANLPAITEAQLSSGEYFEIGNQHIKADHEIFPIRKYSEAIYHNPDFADAYYRCAFAYKGYGEIGLAISYFSQTIRLKPDFVDAYLNRGIAYHDDFRYDHAIADFTKVMNLKPDYADAYYNRGLVYFNKDDYDHAITDYTEAIHLKPDYADAYYNRGNAYFHKGDYDSAIADFTEARRISPNLVGVFVNRGNTYFHKGDYDSAIADFTEAIRLSPYYSYIYFNRGNVYSHKGDYDSAIADFTQVINHRRYDSTAYHNRGNVYFNKGDYDNAIADYDRALLVNPDYQQAQENRELALKKKRGE